MNNMTYANINPDILNFIKKLALLSTDEIYGWLVGYQTQGVPNVISAFDCQNYIQRSYVNAIPDPLEVPKIGGLMPNGIGPIGIYHSHPYKSKVFHSHTDDETLVSLSKQLPNCVSIVTNAEDINYYQMNKDYKLVEIEGKMWKPEIPKFVPISYNTTFKVNIDKELLSADNLHIKIFNKFKDYLEENWRLFKLFKKDKEVPYDTKLEKHLSSSLDGNYLQLKKEEKTAIPLNISKDSTEKKNIITFKLDLTSLDLFYITDSTKTFKDLREAIKTEIVDNSINQKIFSCLINLESKEVIIPLNFFFNLFGYYIKCFYNPQKVQEKLPKDLKINQNFEKLSKKNEEIFQRLKKLVNTYGSVKIDADSRKKLAIFIDNITEFSKNHAWHKNYETELSKIKEMTKKG